MGGLDDGDVESVHYVIMLVAKAKNNYSWTDKSKATAARQYKPGWPGFARFETS